MKRLFSAVLLCVVLMVPLFGCSTDEFVYVPTGDALFNEGDDLEEYLSQGEEEIDVLTMGYYPDRSMNPILCTDYTNRTLFSLMYQSLQ